MKSPRRERPSGAKAPDQTRLKLLRAAEVLFAVRGIDSVSLREVAQASGQRNGTAAQYHFEDRTGLLDAILERHGQGVSRAYEVALDGLMAAGARPTLEQLCRVLVRPVLAKLDDEDNGVAYLSVCAQLAVSPTLPLMERTAARLPGLVRLLSIMEGVVPRDASLAQYRRERVAAALYASLMTRVRLEARGDSGSVSREVFEDDVVAAIVALMQQR